MRLKMDVNTRPNEVFAYLAAALDMQSGFGLCYLFSDDAMGSSWLNNRLQEHVEHDRQLKPSTKFETIFASSDIGSTITQLCQPTKERAVVWCYLPGDKATCQATLVRMNEQRQRLLSSGHFFVLLAPATFEREVPQWAADLWAVRTLLYRWQRTGRMVESNVSASWAASDAKPSLAQVNKTTTAIEAWQRIYAAWQLQPDAKQLSVDLGLLASEQARKMRQFDLAVTLAQQTLAVASTHLGRANALQALGDLKSRLGLVAEAQALYEQAIALYEKEQADLGRANALKALGDLKSRLGLVAEAQALYEQAIALYEKEQADLGRANALQALGDLKSRLGLVAEAQALYEQAIALYEKEQADLGRANALQALGDLKSRLGLVAEAQALYEQAIALYEKEQADLGLGYAWAELATLWATDAASQRQAANAAKKAFHHVSKAGSPPAKEQIIQKLSAVGFSDLDK